MLLMLSAQPLISSLSAALGAFGSGLACALSRVADAANAAIIIVTVHCSPHVILSWFNSRQSLHYIVFTCPSGRLLQFLA